MVEHVGHHGAPRADAADGRAGPRGRDAEPPLARLGRGGLAVVVAVVMLGLGAACSADARSTGEAVRRPASIGRPGSSPTPDAR